MARLVKSSLALHDEDSWRLPDWEEFSESGRSAWTDDHGGSDDESVETDDETRVRLPNARAALAMATTTTLTASKPRLLSLPVADLKALHLRFAQEREQAAAAATTQQECQQQAIAQQLQSVREQLQDFQHKWQSRVDASTAQTLPTAASTAPQEDTSDGISSTTAIVSATATSTGSSHSTGLHFDMAIQTDLEFGDDALRQWLHLIIQKLDVLASSFHHGTTQLPLKYPLQSHLDRPMSLTGATTTAESTDSVASWHVGGSLTTLVGELTASRLLDLERAVACLATATQQTTTRYVSYFEDIVVKIQDLHQQRLRQVVEESLNEMKMQRAKYKKRAEQLELECRTAKEEVIQCKQKAAAAEQVSMMDKEKLAFIGTARQDQWDREKDALSAQVRQLQHEKSQVERTKTETDSLVVDLQNHVDRLTQSLEKATSQLQAHDQKSKEKIDLLEKSQRYLEAQLLLMQQETAQDKTAITQKIEQDRVALMAEHGHEMEQQETTHARQLLDLENKWKAKCESLEFDNQEQQQQQKKRAVPLPTTVDQSIQTDHQEIAIHNGKKKEDEENDKSLVGDAGGDTDKRIARLKKRCKALESLLDKKFEDSSNASMDSGSRWSVHDRDQTFPLTLSFHSSLDGDDGDGEQEMSTMSRNYPVDGEPAAAASSSPPSLQDMWERASSRRSSVGGFSDGSDSGTRRHRSIQQLLGPRGDPEAPTNDEMLALVRKLEALATTVAPSPSPSASAASRSSYSRRQPDEEPEMMSDATPTPTPRKSTMLRPPPPHQKPWQMMKQTKKAVASSSSPVATTETKRMGSTGSTGTGTGTRRSRPPISR